MPFLQSCRRKVVFVGDFGVGSSRLITACMGLEHLSRPALPRVHLGIPGVEEAPKPMSTRSKKKLIRSIRQTELFIVNVAEGNTLEYRRDLYKHATAVAFCFSIEDESSFENIKNKVN